MKKNYVLGIAALSAVVLLAGCGNKELTPTEYCEQNGGVSSEGVCLFEDGSYCGDEAYANGECKAGEVKEEVVAEEEVAEEEVAEEEVAAEEVVAEEENVEGEIVEEENVEEVVVEENAEKPTEEVAE